MAKNFAKDIKPYFTACFRAHMIQFGQFDLWFLDDVQQNWDLIFDRVGTVKDMPPDPGCPEGGWDNITRKQFISDFQDWKTGGFLP